MPDTRPAAPSGVDLDDPQQALRHLGARAHQLRAMTLAADHFNARDTVADRDTGSWLISSAVATAGELAADIDALARALKDRPSDSASQQAVAPLRVRAHQLHAVARAADHFLDQDAKEDRETGSWLVAAALDLARKLASEIDDGASAARRPTIDKATIEPHDAGLTRRVAAATAPLRGAA